LDFSALAILFLFLEVDPLLSFMPRLPFDPIMVRVKDWTVVVHIDAMISRRVTKIDDLVILEYFLK
jgi:hypothetical protein